MRFWILLASCFLIFSLSADKWMDEQISEDLAPFTEASLSPKAIKEEFKAFSQLKRARSYENWGALITIKNGRASADLVNPNPQQNRIKFVVSYLNHLGRRRQYPTSLSYWLMVTE